MDQNSTEWDLCGMVGEIPVGWASTDELPKVPTSSLRSSADQISAGLLGQLPFQELQLHLQV